MASKVETGINKCQGRSNTTLPILIATYSSAFLTGNEVKTSVAISQSSSSIRMLDPSDDFACRRVITGRSLTTVHCGSLAVPIPEATVRLDQRTSWCIFIIRDSPMDSFRATRIYGAI
jgi:hypothetical protein